MVVDKEEFDVIVIGGGCAGYPCSMYSKRFNLKTLVITKQRGGLITTTHLVENWPGEVKISGPELAKKLEEQVIENGIEILDDSVLEIKKNGKFFEILTELKNLKLISKSVVLATGTKHRHLGIESEKKFKGKGVSYCATCDGNFFKNKEVAIIGGGDSSLKETMVLANVCKKVYLICRSKMKGEPINQDRIRTLENVEIIENEQVEEILGENFVEKIKLKSNKEILVKGVFISVGMLPQNELAKQLKVDLNEKGEVIIDKNSKTNVKGIFAAGDLTNSHFKQGIVASQEGSTAANSAFEYITKEFN